MLQLACRRGARGESGRIEIRIDIDRLRDALADYYGTAMMGGMPFAAPDLFEVEGASLEQLVRIAQREGFDLRDFEKK